MVVGSALVVQDATAVRLACGQHTPRCQDAFKETVQEIILETAHHLLLFKDTVLHMKSGYKQESPPP